MRIAGTKFPLCFPSSGAKESKAFLVSLVIPQIVVPEAKDPISNESAKSKSFEDWCVFLGCSVSTIVAADYTSVVG